MRHDLHQVLAGLIAHGAEVMTRDARWYSSVNGGRDVLEFDE
jgi:hypothetical protein